MIGLSRPPAMTTIFVLSLTLLLNDAPELFPPVLITQILSSEADEEPALADESAEAGEAAERMSV